MTTNRREFIERLGATAMLGALPITALHPLVPTSESAAGSAEGWDFSWTNALKGKKHKALFDCTEVESGYGVWRASIWENQYHEALGAKRLGIPDEQIHGLLRGLAMAAVEHGLLVVGQRHELTLSKAPRWPGGPAAASARPTRSARPPRG